MPKAAKKEPAEAAGEELAQVAAIPLREREGGVEVCLVTTRETRRWSVPKGWQMKGRKDWAAAAIEAEQEAGLVGSVSKKPIGDYRYWKRLKTSFVLVRVSAFRLDVTSQLASWQEQGQRSVRWCSL